MSTSISATEIGLPDNAKLKLGTGEDLQIYHDGSNSYLSNNGGVGNLLLYGNGTNSVVIQPVAGENSIVANSNSSVELFFDNSKKLETTSSGVSFANGADATTSKLLLALGNASNKEATIQGISDSTNEKGIEFKTYSFAAKTPLTLTHDGHLKVPDSSRLKIGDGDDLQIYHDGSNTFVQNSTGSFVINADAYRINNQANNENIIKADANGAVELYYDNAKRFETLTDGTQSRGLTKHLSEDQNVTQTIQPLYLSIPTNTTKTITLTLLLGTGRFTAGGYANAGQGALALNIFFGGAMFATQHYDVNVLQNNAMQNTSTSLTKNGTSYVIAITNNSSSYPLNLSMLLESTGRPMNYAVA